MKRIQRQRVKGYKTPENARYVGRPTKFGNPFKLTKDGFIMALSTNRRILDKWILFTTEAGATQKDIIALYKMWLEGKLHKKFTYLPKPPNIEELRSQDYLSCFCSLKVDCHVDVIIEKLNRHE